GEGRYSMPVWSSAMQQLAFVSSAGATVQIFRMESDGSDKVSLWKSSGGSQAPQVNSLAWSPTEKWLLFVTSQGGCTFELNLLDTKSGSVQHLDTKQCGPIFASWSPDGERILRAAYYSGNWRV